MIYIHARKRKNTNKFNNERERERSFPVHNNSNERKKTKYNQSSIHHYTLYIFKYPKLTECQSFIFCTEAILNTIHQHSVKSNVIHASSNPLKIQLADNTGGHHPFAYSYPAFIFRSKSSFMRYNYIFTINGIGTKSIMSSSHMQILWLIRTVRTVSFDGARNNIDNTLELITLKRIAEKL